MEWKEFKTLVTYILREGRRLQRCNIAGEVTTKGYFTQTEITCFVGATAIAILLPEGISDNFAEYSIEFLGIFVGLFTTIIISLYDKGKALYDRFEEKTHKEKARANLLRNYLLQFTGLTAYSIVLALIAVVLLLGILLFPGMRTDVREFRLASGLSLTDANALWSLGRLLAVVVFRVTLFSLLLNFFMVTLFSLSSYFSFLLKEYKKLGKREEDQ